MEERKEKRHLQGMRNVLLAFAFCFVCALFVGVSPVYAAKQECDYKITEADQDFITWFKANMYGSERLKQYVYIRSMGDSWSVVSSDRPLRKIKIRDSWLDNIEPGTTYGSSIIKKVGNGYTTHTDFSYSVADDNCVGVSWFGNDLIWSNYNVLSGVGVVKDNKYYFEPSDTVFFSQPLNWTDNIKEIPKVVRVQARVIILVVVSCLALLIGCLTLLPRLKVFLH